MPFDFAAYKAKCDAMSTEALQLEWQNYTRQLTTGATMTATSVMLSPMTSGISLVGLGISVPQLHNARKKRAIVGNKMQLHGAEPHTRRRDVIIPAAISVTAAGLTLGITPTGAEFIGGEAGAKGIEYLVTHATLDALWSILDEAQNAYHHRISKRKLRKSKLKQKEYMAQASKMSEYSQIGIDAKRNDILDGKLSSNRAESLRAYYLENHENVFDNEDLPPPLYQKKYVYQGGQAKASRSNSSISHPPILNRRSSQLSVRRLNYSSSSIASEDSSRLRHTAASRRISASGDHRPRILRPATPSSPPGTDFVPSLQVGEDSDFENRSESDDSSELEEEDDSENEEIVEGEKKKEKIIEHVLTLEQEVTMLKATILRMELERRGLVSVSDPNVDPNLVHDNEFVKISKISAKKEPAQEKNSSPESRSTQRLRNKIKSPVGQNQVSSTPRTQNRPPLSRRTNELDFQRPKPQNSIPRQNVESVPVPIQEPSQQENQISEISSSEQQSNEISSREQIQRRPLRKRHDSGYFSISQNNLSVASTPGGVFSNCGTPDASGQNVDRNDAQTPPPATILAAAIQSDSKSSAGYLKNTSVPFTDQQDPLPNLDQGILSQLQQTRASRNSSPIKNGSTHSSTSSSARRGWKDRVQMRPPILNQTSDEILTQASSSNNSIKSTNDLDDVLSLQSQTLRLSMGRSASSFAATDASINNVNQVIPTTIAATSTQILLPLSSRSWRAPV
ncbi:hypothetical protein GcC1_045020 [Golovinomyces cichoracearum]|uniref:Uncharacterized protein n=1 Tax=Golovinomyces cichoracearum TaxID=62708 RepID=A0A420IYD4_9PEZI|nr:hypothetical protein GcC1_045020 [Golovinomyces cichoracearum]